MRTVFRERISRKTTRYEEQILSKDKYSRILPMQIQLGNIRSREAFTPMPAGVITSAVTYVLSVSMKSGISDIVNNRSIRS